MALLPSGYKVCNSIGGYYNSGIVSQSGLEVDALFYVVALTEGFLFGARNTNSNTSAGQLYRSTNYFGYRNARISNSIEGHQGYLHIYTNDNYCEVNGNMTIKSVSGSQSTFTGTRPMYINNYNNAGSAGTSAGGLIYGFVIKKDGVKLRDFVPAFRESDSTYGLYDLVEGEFHASIATYSPTLYTAQIQQSSNGKGYIKTYHGELVEEVLENSPTVLSEPIKNIRAIAVPNDGYEFKGWEVNGTIVSRNRVYDFGITADTTLIPRFTKITSIELNQGCFARIKEYGLQDWDDFQISSAQISDSALEKATSQVVLEKTSSTILPGCPIRIYSPKGKEIYSGMIEAVEGDTLTCRESLAFYDMDYIFKTGTIDSSTNNVLYGLKYLFAYGSNARDFSNQDYLLSNRNGFIYNETNRFAYQRMSQYYDEISHVLFPSIEATETKNLEDFVHEFVSYGIFTKAVYTDTELLHFEPYYFKNNEKLSFGDNFENISNIQITEESQEGTIVEIFNSTGATLRGMYGVLNDGSIARYDQAGTIFDDFVGLKKYVGDVVLSDDPISTILADKLSSSFLNHKITFDVARNGLLFFDQLQIGTPVHFYVGSRMFNSVITAISFEIPANQEDIQTINVTLGNVRTSLTSKLNLRKSK